MKDTDLYSRILGLSEPWFVADVALDTQEAEWQSMLIMLPASGGAVRRGQARKKASPTRYLGINEQAVHNGDE